MGPYSHFVIASKLETSLHPDRADDYYWGAVAPDIRYLAQMRRSHTHLEKRQFMELDALYPNLRSFLLGFQVHCLTDQVDFYPLIQQTFPLRQLKNFSSHDLSRQQMTILVELYYLQSMTTPCILSGRHNEILTELGIQPEQTREYHRAAQEYINSKSPDQLVMFLRKLGMVDDTRVSKYLQAYNSLRKHPLMRALLMMSIRNAGLDQVVTSYVQRNLTGL